MPSAVLRRGTQAAPSCTPCLPIPSAPGRHAKHARQHSTRRRGLCPVPFAARAAAAPPEPQKARERSRSVATARPLRRGRRRSRQAGAGWGGVGWGEDASGRERGGLSSRQLADRHSGIGHGHGLQAARGAMHCVDLHAPHVLLLCAAPQPRPARGWLAVRGACACRVHVGGCAPRMRARVRACTCMCVWGGGAVKG